MKDYLSTMQGAWQQTAAPSQKAYEELPDGTYQVKMETAQLKEGQTPFLQWGMRVISGPHAGRMLFKVQRLVVDSLPYLKADLELLQIRLDDLGALEGMLARSLDAILDVKVKTSNGKDGTAYKQVFFNRLVREGAKEAQQAIPAGFTPVDEEKLPWE